MVVTSSTNLKTQIMTNDVTAAKEAAFEKVPRHTSQLLGCESHYWCDESDPPL